MKPVTDPSILEQLNAGRRPVSDPDILARLNGGSKEKKNPLTPAYMAFQGAADIPQNMMRFLTNYGGNEENKNRMEEQHKKREQSLEEIGGDTSDWWRTGGNIAASLPGGMATIASKTMLGKGAERIATAATEAGLFGAASPDLDAPKASAVGGGVAAGIEGLAATARGAKGIPGAVGKAVSRLLPMSEGARAADDFAAARNIPIAGEDLVQNNIIRSTGRMIDNADPSNFRNRQLSRMDQEFQREIVDPFATFDDPIAEMGESLGRKYKAVQSRSSDLYDAAYKDLNRLGPVPLSQFGAKLRAMQEQYASRYGEKSAEVRELTKWFDYGEETVEGWAKRRQKLGRDIRKAQRSADPDHADIELLTGIRDALDDNLDKVAGQNNLYRKANDFYRREVVPYKEEAYKKLVKKGKTEKAINDALAERPTAGTEEHFKQVWTSLDEPGKVAYRQQMLQSIMDKARNPETGFSPSVAATQMDRLRNRLGDDVLGADLAKAMDGWNNLFRQSGFAAESVARSRTGASVAQVTAPLAVGAGLMAAPMATLAAATPLMPALLVRSRKVRQILAKLADMKPQHQDYSQVVQDLLAEIERGAAKAQAVAE